MEINSRIFSDIVTAESSFAVIRIGPICQGDDMNESDYQQLSQKAWEAVQEADERFPKDGDHCFCVTYPASPAVGGTVRGFLSFETQTGMLNYLKEYGLFQFDGHERKDFETGYDRIQLAVNNWDSHDLAALAASLNQHLPSGCKFTWMGTWDELLQGSQGIAPDIRREFRQKLGRKSSKVIDSVERDIFLRFLKNSGH